MRQQPKLRPSTSSSSSGHASPRRADFDGDGGGADNDETRSLTGATAPASAVSVPPLAPSPKATRAHDTSASLEIEVDVEHDYENDDILDSDDDDDNSEQDGVGFLYPNRYSSSSRRFNSNYSSLSRNQGGRGSSKSRRKLYRLLAILRVPPFLISHLPLCAGATIVGLVLILAVLYKPTKSGGDDVWAVGNHHHHGSSSNGVYSCPQNNDTAATDEMLTHFLDRVDHLPQKERCVVRPGQRGCPCQGSSLPAMPNEVTWNESWQIAHERNQQLAQKELDSMEGERPLDVILLGDSITEAWLGTSLAQPAPKFADNYKAYQSLFRDSNAPLRGLALGIAGDRCTQLLYRLQNGEVPAGLNAKVFWILIGTNDFLWGSCHADEIVAGNVKITQTLLQQYPGTTVVLQSLLPVSTSRIINGEAYPAAQSWEYYPDINQRLDCYAQSTSNVEFVNVTQLFLVPGAKNAVNDTMLPDGLHPGGVAATIWGSVIVENVQRILKGKSGRGRYR